MDGQADWYRKQHVLNRGEKRSFDQVNLEEGTEVQTGTEEKEMDHYQPWWMFRDQGLAAHRGLEAIEKEWTDRVDVPGSSAIYRRGEWLLPRFAGIMHETVQKDLNIQSTKRIKRVDDGEQLKTLQQVGLKLINGYLNEAQKVVPRSSEDTLGVPAVQRSIAEAAESPQVAVDIMDVALNREVSSFPPANT